jgi:hypothetical protein
MKANIRKIIGASFILTILLVPTVSAVQQASTNYEGVFFAIYSHRGKIGMSIANYGNESVNYTLMVVYGFFRSMLFKRLSPRVILENGTVAPDSSVEKLYKVRFSFSPIVAALQIDNKSLIYVGFVFGKRVRFKTMIVMENLSWFYPVKIE